MGNNTPSVEKLSLDFRFFWKKNKDPWNESSASWVPYDLQDNIEIEKNFQNFLKNKNDNFPIIGDYIIDFENFLQINKKDQNKQRPIKRDLPLNITNIIRKNRNYISYISSNNRLNIIDKNNLNNLIKGVVECEFKVIPDVNFKIKVTEHLNFFNNEINIEFKIFQDLLSSEINDLSIRLNRENVYSKMYLDNLNHKNFFVTILKIYTEESFLYQELNRILRDGNSKDYELIKYYYTSLLASFEYFSKENAVKLNKILNKNNRKLFRGSYISPEEIKLYTESQNVVRRMDCFLSSTYDIEIAKGFVNDDNKSCLIEIEIPDDNNLYKNLALLKDHSVFSNEKEVLIRSGALIYIKKFETNDKTNLHHIRISLISLKGLKFLISTNEPITEIDLCGKQITDNEVKYIADALQNNTKLNKIVLTGNQIGEKGAEYLACALEKNITLKIINLEANEIGDKGAKYIANALEKNTTLKIINLAYNQIGDNGAKHIAWALETNNNLSDLILSSNNIGYKGAMYLAYALEKNKALITISLENNLIGDKGAKYFAYLLGKNKTLITISLKFNQIEDKGAKYITDATEKNQKLNSIIIIGNENGMKTI